MRWQYAATFTLAVYIVTGSYSVKESMKDEDDGLTQRNIALVEAEQGCG